LIKGVLICGIHSFLLIYIKQPKLPFSKNLSCSAFFY